MANSIIKRLNRQTSLPIILLLLVAMLALGSSAAFGAEDTTWQNDWTNTRNATAKTITLTKYNGSETEYKVPAKAVIDGEEYTVILGNGNNSGNLPFAGTSITKLSVEEGVKINNPNYLFYQATGLVEVDLTGADMTAATTMQGMFYGATGLKKVSLHGVDASKVTNVRYMFDQATAVEEVDFSDLNMSSVRSFLESNPDRNRYTPSPLFHMYNLKKVNFSNFDTSSLTTAQRMFTIDAANSGNRNMLEEIDVTGWKTPKVTSFSEIFKHCGENVPCTITGLEAMDTSSGTDFMGAFQSCYLVEDLSGVGQWDMSKAVYINNMFSECKSITSLDLSGWDTSNATTLSSMFFACEKLTDLTVNTWNTSKVKEMSEIFKGCTSLEVLDIGSWTTESVQGVAGSHQYEMFGIGNSMNAGDYGMTPLKEITLNENFEFFPGFSPGLRGGYWHLKEGTEEQVAKKFTPARFYNAYNNGITPGEGYTYPHTYVLTELDPAEAQYYAHGWGQNNVWEVHYPDDKFKGYCINLHRGSPNGYYDRTKVSGNQIVDEGFLDSEDYGWEPLSDNNMEEALITLIYYGWGNDADGIQAKYGLSDFEYMMVTQQAIWDMTDRYSNKPERDPETPSGKAYNELMSKRFADIPDGQNLTLYLYESIGGQQNLLSISGLNSQAYAGVRILKMGEPLDSTAASVPLKGAEFTIFNEDGENMGTIVSDENGYATKYNTDSIYGLPEGVYTIRETSAPRGYNRGSDWYTFIVRPEDDNTIVLVGKLKGEGEDTAMVFSNTENSTQGGGIEITKLDEKGEPLMGATFEILDSSGYEMAVLTTGPAGTAKTGDKELPFGEYTVKEVTAPEGYIKEAGEKTVTVSENKVYESVSFTNKTKKGSVTIQATKKYNEDLKGKDFTFQLVDDLTGDVVATATNDKNGNIKFSLDYTGEDIGYKVYQLREVKGSQRGVTYDAHQEQVIVYISDEGEDTLTCTAEYESETVGAAFTNTMGTRYTETYSYKGNYPKVVMDTLPDRKGTYFDGETLVPADPTTTEVKVKGGKWVFQGWSKEKATIEGADVEFVGTWLFVADTPEDPDDPTPGDVEPPTPGEDTPPAPPKKPGTVKKVDKSADTSDSGSGAPLAAAGMALAMLGALGVTQRRATKR